MGLIDINRVSSRLVEHINKRIERCVNAHKLYT